MQKRLRHSRHSRAAPRPPGLVRAALLWGLALPSAACPAVVDLDPEEDAPDGAIEAPPGFLNQFDAGAEDAPSQRVIAPAPDANPAAPCAAPPAPGTGATAAASQPGSARAPNGSGLLGPDAALRAVLAAGYSLPCGTVQVVTTLAEGYELSALGPSGPCRPFETTLYRLRVSRSGEVTILDAVAVGPGELRCDAGQPEIVFTAPPLA
jgi:hypothetical protein